MICNFPFIYLLLHSTNLNIQGCQNSWAHESHSSPAFYSRSQRYECESCFFPLFVFFKVTNKSHSLSTDGDWLNGNVFGQKPFETNQKQIKHREVCSPTLRIKMVATRIEHSAVTEGKSFRPSSIRCPKICPRSKVTTNFWGGCFQVANPLQK